MNHYITIILASLFFNCYSLISKEEFVEKLLYLVEQNSTHTLVPGENVLLWKDGQFHCGGSGMIKALLNGYDIYNVIEGYKFSEYPITGDLDSKGLIEGCIDVNDQFYYMHHYKNVPRLLYLEGHIGVYIGKEVKMR